MRRSELEHVIRASSAIAEDNEVIVIGSQAILGQFPDAPAELLRSNELDVVPKNKPERSIVVDGAIGELSAFHHTFGYYAHGVAVETAVLPAGWRERLIRVCNENTKGAVGWYLEVHDLAASKLAAGGKRIWTSSPRYSTSEWQFLKSWPNVYQPCLSTARDEACSFRGSGR